jgi:hypothetical protein
MAAILVIKPKDPLAPFRHLQATYFPSERMFRFRRHLKERERVTFVGVYNLRGFSGDISAIEFEEEVIVWICSGGLTELIKIILGVYDSHVKTLTLSV